MLTAANLKPEDAAAAHTYKYFEKQGKLSLLDTFTNDHIVMTSPMILINDKIIACPSQGVAVPIEDIDEMVGADQGRANWNAAMITFGSPLFLKSGKNGRRSRTSLKDGIRFFTKNDQAFDINVNKYEFSRLIKKNPELLPGNIRMIDIF